MLRFGMERKLASRYIEPFDVIKRVRPMVYKLDLPLYLDKIHDVFHIFLLKKAEVDPSQFLLQVILEINKDLIIKVKSVKILDRSEKELRKKKNLMLKVLWRNSQI
jgi:hypothetical protein